MTRRPVPKAPSKPPPAIEPEPARKVIAAVMIPNRGTYGIGSFLETMTKAAQDGDLVAIEFKSGCVEIRHERPANPEADRRPF